MLAVVAYLRSVTPIPHKLEKSTFHIPLPERFGPAVVHVTDVPSDDKVCLWQVSRGHWPLHGLPHADDRGSS